MASETTKKKQTILVVDDEPINRTLVARVLQSRYNIAEAGTVAEAVSLLEKQASTISLILCDYLMPGDLGTELASVVKEKWPNITFLLLTGYDTDETIERALEDGSVCEILAKPWRSRALKELLLKWL